MQPLQTINPEISQKNNHATSPQKNLPKNNSGNLSEWEKSHNLSTQKNHETSKLKKIT